MLRKKEVQRQIGHGVAAVVNQAGAPVGTAFLVDHDTVITCAHVVNLALGRPMDSPDRPTEPVSLRFVNSWGGDPVKASVHTWTRPTREEPEATLDSSVDDASDDDIAVLRLDRRAPDGVEPVRLAEAGRGIRCMTMGFPDTHDIGNWLDGRLRGQVGRGWIQIDAPDIAAGYSGGPVLDADSTAADVVGMLAAYHTAHKSGYMIPASRLREVLERDRHPSAPDDGLNPIPGPAGPARRGRLARYLWLLVLVALAATAGTLTVVLPGLTRHTGCPLPTQLRVAVAPETASLYQAVASGYENWVAGRHGGCHTVDLYLYPLRPDPGSVAGAGVPRFGQILRLDGTGMHPDLWLGPQDAAAGLRASAVDASAAWPTSNGNAAATTTVTTIGRSPLVLAVPVQRYQAKEQTMRQSSWDWPELFAVATSPSGKPVAGAPIPGATGTGWGVVRPDPATSLVGRLATALLYPDRITSSTARTRIELPIENAQDAGLYPPGDETDLLCRQRELDVDHRAALIVTEQAALQFNRGRALGTACGPLPPPKGPPQLIAFYPRDTVAVYQAAVSIRWADPLSVQSAVVRQAAAEFVRWISQEPDGKKALRDEGLRAAGDTVEVLSGFNPDGALSEWPFVHEIPTPIDPTKALRIYASAHRHARALVALDQSGSMRTVVDASGRTRFNVAVQGVRDALGRMADRDEFGLDLFSTALPGAGIKSEFPLQPRTHNQVGALDQLLDGVATQVPTGNTPLYRAIDTGVVTVRKGGLRADQFGAVVVLTDGQNTEHDEHDDLPDAIAGHPRVRVFVVAIGEASCGVPQLVKVTTATGGRCVTASVSTMKQVLGGLLDTLWGEVNLG
jgi:trypsin-like peptidase/von Willebrand factor type A domain-containing protein